MNSLSLLELFSKLNKKGSTEVEERAILHEIAKKINVYSIEKIYNDSVLFSNLDSLCIYCHQKEYDEWSLFNKKRAEIFNNLVPHDIDE